MKRIYEESDLADGTRILLDRFWPRGIKKTGAQLDYWAKELTPSTELRKWFNHEKEKMPVFTEAYQKELLSSSLAKTKMQELILVKINRPKQLLRSIYKDELNY